MREGGREGRGALALPFALAGAALVGLLVLGAAHGRSLAAELARPRDLHGEAHATSDACAKCHLEEHASWRRSYHRTMTQEARGEAVLGDFDEAELEYGGVLARFSRDPDGTPTITVAYPDGEVRYRVERTVGSHRYQQYLARAPGGGEGELSRLPVAWRVDEGRWFHMNGAFLTPDPPLEEGRVSRADYDRHVTRWNDNCVFCHNVAADPGLGSDGTFDTRVAELGVACEACHGPAAEHVRANRDPLRRYALHLSDRPDPTIVNPARLSPERSADVCGRCHGQRKTDDVARFLRRGDPFVPGDDLSLYSEPLWVDTTLGDAPYAFALRFWADGTPRLSAYELQGLLQSPCAIRGELTCTTCHGMHEGDPAGQMRPDAAGDGGCGECHADLASDHARHGDAQVACVDCHMPRLVYGLVDALPSHRIEVPDPEAAARADRPDACTLCHVDRGRAWAAAGLARLWGGAETEPVVLADDAPWAPDHLFGGDPIARVVAARALGDSPLGEPAWKRALLLEALAGERYPAVRRTAWRSLRRLAPQDSPDLLANLEAYRPAGAASDRAATLAATRRLLGPLPPIDPARVAALRARAREVDIDIGE